MASARCIKCPAGTSSHSQTGATERVSDVTNNGVITTLAGTGAGGYNGDSIDATTAQLKYPFGIAVDPKSGAVMIADQLNSRVRSIGK